MRAYSWLVFVHLVFGGSLALAKNVDLVTLPMREGVQLTIYNSADLTLVRERRNITVRQGRNRLQFSWTNTLIDPTSVELRVRDHQDELELLDTTFPGQKPQHLIWNIDSEFEGQVPVEVSYFTSGIRWAMDYVVTADPELATAHVQGYVRVSNSSGEEYEDAQIRLIVGKVNLVEPIARLAAPETVEDFEDNGLDRFKKMNNRPGLKLRAVVDSLESYQVAEKLSRCQAGGERRCQRSISCSLSKARRPSRMAGRSECEQSMRSMYR